MRKDLHNSNGSLANKVGEKLVRLSHSDFLRSLLIAIAWQCVITVLALFVVSVLAPHTMSNAPATTPTHYIFNYATHWDGVWYMGIINGSYTDHLSYSPVFYPLFPAIIWVLSKVTFGLFDITALSLLLNTVCLAVAIYSLKKISQILIPKISPWLAPIFFLLTPAAIFMNLFYVEALLCALGFLAYYFALKRMWLWCCVVLALATSVKLAGLMFVGLCILEFLQSHNWNIKRVIKNPRWLYFFLAPLGFIGYSVYLHFVHGDALGMFHDIAPWAYNHFDPNFLHTIFISARHVFHSILPGSTFDEVTFVNFVLPVVAILMTIAASIYSFVRIKNIPLGIFGLVAVVVFTINSNVVSVHRYLLPIFITYLALAHLTQYRRLRPFVLTSVYVGVLLQMLLLALFVVNIFAG